MRAMILGQIDSRTPDTVVVGLGTESADLGR
jgi:hypothetical protein